MTNLRPGKIVKTFTTKKGKQAVIRYPKWEDLDLLLEYINTLSKEDTFINFSGEELSKKEEAEFLARLFVDIEMVDRVILCCFIDDQLVGSCDIERDKGGRKRSRHVGIFGISITKEYRGEGIGYELAKATIEEARERISELKLIILDVFNANQIAQVLYEKLGFQKAGQIPKAVLYQKEYLDEVKMYLEL